ncbi:hypothetical protein ACQP1V_25940 [Microtetraspora malaysiensis]|uniref:hypothetical protein n=1 Tax=Microtetraspora malaysiensis TaxID=161358 RepID=UPI003D8CAFDC
MTATGNIVLVHDGFVDGFRVSIVRNPTLPPRARLGVPAHAGSRQEVDVLLGNGLHVRLHADGWIIRTPRDPQALTPSRKHGMTTPAP